MGVYVNYYCCRLLLCLSREGVVSILILHCVKQRIYVAVKLVIGTCMVVLSQRLMQGRVYLLNTTGVGLRFAYGTCSLSVLGVLH